MFHIKVYYIWTFGYLHTMKLNAFFNILFIQTVFQSVVRFLIQLEESIFPTFSFEPFYILRFLVKTE